MIVICKIYYRKTNSENKLPVCINQRVKLQFYHYEKVARGYHKNMHSKTELESCSLFQYTAKPVVSCLDQIYDDYKKKDIFYTTNGTRNTNELHFAFIGDSRIRQQYFNFIKVGDLDLYSEK